MGNLIMQIFRGMKGSYAFQLLGKAFLRLRTAVMNPFQRVVRRVQQIFNVNIITSRLVAPINAKVRKILNGEANPRKITLPSGGSGSPRCWSTF